MNKEELKKDIDSLLEKHNLSMEELATIVGGVKTGGGSVDDIINGKNYNKLSDWILKLLGLHPDQQPRTRKVKKQNRDDIDL